MIHLRPRNPHAKAGVEPHFHAWHRYVVMELNFGLVRPPRLGPQDRCSFSAIGAPTTLSRALFLGSKCEINARDRAKGIADLSLSRGGGSIARPLLSRKAARVDRLRLHTSQHARSPWIPSLSLFHATRKEAMAMSCKFVGKNAALASKKASRATVRRR